MNKYAIYTYELTEKPRRNEILTTEEAPIEKMKPETRFELLFGKERGAELRVQKLKKNGTADKYPCQVLNHDENIILLRLIYDKNVNIWEEHPTTAPVSTIEKTKMPSKPFCYIFIDNRLGMRQIAIQSDSAAWRNTNDVKDLLQESLNRLLYTLNYGLVITIRTKMMPSKFWDYVDYKRKKEKVYIKSMVFSFTNYKRHPEIDLRSALSSEWKHFESFMNLVDSIGAGKGEIKLTPPRNNELLKDRRRADIKHMVEICMNSNYSLSVTFSDDVTYKCNDNLRAEFPMNDESLRIEFEERHHDLFHKYRLTVWLNEIKQKTEEYDDIEEVKRKPNSKDKKQIS